MPRTSWGGFACEAHPLPNGLTVVSVWVGSPANEHWLRGTSTLLDEPDFGLERKELLQRALARACAQEIRSLMQEVFPPL